ncbi:hypothetical protein ET445_01100 [Agromyces protaetiae]|uniref:Uncharacterized protein n=1 Tax=Agromyces protaetiae TaxID=2509455 RepID=A0A4P6FNT5_9MICO|nr:hypothetical protein [Agromyces protaetiae]QAY72138.1 hypothetical protein ET445_01100 [Agromyces protaetiae]
MEPVISVEPEQVFGDVTKLVRSLESLPSTQQCMATPTGDSVARFAGSYDDLAERLGSTVDATRRAIQKVGGQIREAVVSLAAQDEALKAEADAVVGMLDSVLPPQPVTVAPRAADQTAPSQSKPVGGSTAW